tara:strand:+ start:180108 stop:180725 length:618 start_codon:yes stop_codon:yes gene_type:complete
MLKLIFFTGLCLILFTSCSSTTKYGLVAGAQKANYKETADVSSVITGNGTLLPDYTNEGNGFFIGISEELPWILTKIVYFQNKYEDKDYSYDGTTYATALSESGIRGSLALKFGFFQPFISFASYNSEYEVNGSSDETDYTALGYGVDLEFNVGKDKYIYLGIELNTYEDTVVDGLVFAEQTLEHQTIYLGYRQNFWTVGGKGSK